MFLPVLILNSMQIVSYNSYNDKSNKFKTTNFIITASTTFLTSYYSHVKKINGLNVVKEL